MVSEILKKPLPGSETGWQRTIKSCVGAICICALVLGPAKNRDTEYWSSFILFMLFGSDQLWPVLREWWKPS